MGAPEADSGQPDVIKGGAVFKCPPEAPGQCDLIPFDTKGKTLFICMKNEASKSSSKGSGYEPLPFLVP